MTRLDLDEDATFAKVWTYEESEWGKMLIANRVYRNEVRGSRLKGSPKARQLDGLDESLREKGLNVRLGRD